jgi:hypothetical protein
MKKLLTTMLFATGLLLTQMAIAQTANYVVCSFNETIKTKPYLNTIHTVFFEKHSNSISAYRSTFKYNNVVSYFSITERATGLTTVSVSTDKNNIIYVDSALPIKYVGDYSSPTIAVSAGKHYLMCREGDLDFINESFPEAVRLY